MRILKNIVVLLGVLVSFQANVGAMQAQEPEFLYHVPPIKLNSGGMVFYSASEPLLFFTLEQLKVTEPLVTSCENIFGVFKVSTKELKKHGVLRLELGRNFGWEAEGQSYYHFYSENGFPAALLTKHSR